MAHRHGTDESTLSIIAAFTHARDLSHRMRRRSSNQAARNRKRDAQTFADLSASIVQAPRKIEDHYADGHRIYGRRFDDGDEESYEALQGALRMLNDGLVQALRILVGETSVNLVYNLSPLTSLCDSICVQVCRSLLSLRSRLKGQVFSPLQLSPSQARPSGRPKTHDLPNSKHRGVEVARLKFTDSRQSQLGLVKSRGKQQRKHSYSSSASDSSTVRTDSASPAGSPMASPQSSTPSLQALSPAVDQSRASLPHRTKQAKSPPPTSATTSTALAVRTPPMRPLEPRQCGPSASPRTEPPPAYRSQAHQPRLSLSPVRSPPAYDRQPRPRLQPPPPPRPASASNRESVFSFASDSTKLGEIPMHRWPEPFDFDRADRINNSDVNAWTQDQVAHARAERARRPGLLKRLFRGRPERLGAVMEE